ncbi:hypothetical protein [Clostridium chrysemydis]|uniref:hypothetical protein n=1 Tax=Clostridium chrysemydis TaxID=2665504 RepID=UPI00188324D1|nr:hypothetical protein [Clostridium chrysemydis]
MKKIFKSLGKSVLYIGLYLVMLFVYIIFVPVQEYHLSYIVTAGTLIFIGFMIFLLIKRMVKRKDKRIGRGILVFANIVLLTLVVGTNYMVNNIQKSGNAIARLLIESEEPLGYDEKFIKEDYKGIEIFYNENSKLTLDILKKKLDFAIKECKKVYGDKEANFKIKLDYDEDVFFKRANGNHFVKGYYVAANNTIYLNAGDPLNIILSGRIPLQEVLKHEISHYYLYKMVEEIDILNIDIPRWVDEGLAEYTAGRIICKKELGGEEIITFENLKDGEGFNTEYDIDQYKQSSLAVKTLIDKYGEDIIFNIIKEMKNSGEEFSISFEKVTGKTFSSFERELRKSVLESKSNCTEVHGNKEYLDLFYEKVETVKKYIKENKKSPRAYEFLATHYISKGEKDKGVKMLEEGLKYNKNDKDLKDYLKSVKMN